VAHFDQIGEYGLDQVLAKRLTTPGGAVAPTVAPELFAGITLENDRPEWGWLKSEIPYGMVRTPTAPAATTFLTLTNPAGSGVIAVVRRIRATASSGIVQMTLCPNNALGTTTSGSPGIPRDGRATAFSGGIFTRRSVCLTETADAAAFTAAALSRSSGVTLEYQEPLIVSPGTQVIINSTTATATLAAEIAWTERRANPGEL